MNLVVRTDVHNDERNYFDQSELVGRQHIHLDALNLLVYPLLIALKSL